MANTGQIKVTVTRLGIEFARVAHVEKLTIHSRQMSSILMLLILPESMDLPNIVHNMELT